MIGYMSQQWLCSENRITCLRKKRRVMIVTSLQGQRKSGFFKSFIFLLENSYFRDFCHSLVVKNLPSVAGGTASIPGWGTKIPHATGCSQKKTQPVILLAIPHLFWQCYICALLETESFSSAKQIWTDWHVAIFSFIYFSMFFMFCCRNINRLDYRILPARGVMYYMVCSGIIFSKSGQFWIMKPFWPPRVLNKESWNYVL